jgi:hypothetical protein
MSNWQKVYISYNNYRAQIVKDVLDGHLLPSIILNKKDTSYHWGYFEVYVSPDHVLRAKKIIEDEIRFE